ncbi:hypothetical protein VIM7927_00227 [Vibrio mangrovi]|uniref:Uncharacterized protein n=1 Tax=Vibrio mangrovi TaxID=474394 RepID=A0A1Y6IMW8_9VIBR|nr:hypothetical protein VIM7927_00227 [Vibrio mangrovi]
MMIFSEVSLKIYGGLSGKIILIKIIFQRGINSDNG